MLSDKEGGVTWKNKIQAPPPSKLPLLIGQRAPLTCDTVSPSAHTYPPPLIPPSRSTHIPRDNPFLDMIKGVDTQRRFC